MNDSIEIQPTPPAGESRAVWWFKEATMHLEDESNLFGKELDQSLHPPALPVFTTITQDLKAAECQGGPTSLSSLRGKVFTCAYLYTLCPHGCSAVMGQMSHLHQRFGSRTDFQQVSIAVAPDRDTPSFLRTYAEGMGIKPGDSWWFLSGDQKLLWDFMEKQLLLTPSKPIPEKDRLNPLDLYEHDLRVVLIDRKGRVRGYYAVFHPQAEIARLMCDHLQRDTEALLNHPEL